MKATRPRARTTDEPALASGGLELGYIVGFRAGGEVMVSVAGGAPRPARDAVGFPPERLEQARRDGEVAVLMRAGAHAGATDADRLILGLAPPPLRTLEPPPSAAPGTIIADADGRRLLIRAQDEIVFECGKASVTLRRNGRVIIRGTHIETDAEGANRIKGGQVRIN